MWYNRRKEVIVVNQGKIFEKDVKDSIPDSVFYFRIKDPAQSFGADSKFTRFSLKNEFDAFIYKYPILVAIELKSNQGTSISFSLTGKEQKDIKKNQIDALTNCTKFNIKSGFLLNFRKTQHTYWIDIRDFNKFTHDTTKKSINEKDIIEYGGIIVRQQLKKIHYRYDLSFLWSDEKNEQTETT